MLLGATAGGVAVPVASLSNWSLDYKTDRVDVTSFGDTNKQYVQGLPDIQGSFAGFWDDSDTTVRQASGTAGVNTYLYPDFTNAPTKYAYGLATVDFSLAADVGDAVKVTGSFGASGNWDVSRL